MKRNEEIVVNRYYAGTLTDIFEKYTGVIIIHDEEDVKRLKENINSKWVNENANFFVVVKDKLNTLYIINDIIDIDANIYYIHYPIKESSNESILNNGVGKCG